MNNYKNLAFKATVSTLIIFSLMGCGGSDSETTNQGVNEFTSLEHRAKVEQGYVILDGIETKLSYTAEIINRKPKGYLGYIGVFAEEQNEQVLALSSDDGQQPNMETLFVNIPNIKDGYFCEDLDTDEKSSTQIKGHDVIFINATDCQGSGINKGKTKDVRIKITESMLSSGSSRLDVKGTKAYLKTDYIINDNISVSGGLGTRAYNQIFNLIQNNPAVTTIVEGHISGSIHDDINMQTGRLIRKAGLVTHITKTSNIASGGVDLFCSGKIRTMEDGAKVGVHSWAGDDVEAGELPIGSPLHQNQIDYFTEMLGSPTGKDFYFYTINAASADDIYQMNRAEMEAYKLLTE